MINRLNSRFFQKSWLFIRILFIALLLSTLLPLLKFPNLISRINHIQRTKPTKDDISDIIQIIGLISSCRFLVIRNNCFKKSLLYYYFLGKAGVHNLEIVIGINKTHGKLLGHSWLILDNRLYLEDEENVKEYKVIYSSGVRP